MGDFHLTSDEDIQYLITCEKDLLLLPNGLSIRIGISRRDLRFIRRKKI